MDRTSGIERARAARGKRQTPEDYLAALQAAEEGDLRVNASSPGQLGSEAEQSAWEAPAPETRGDGRLRGAPDYRRMRPLTPKQIAFARGVIEGKSLKEAYREAYGSGATDESVSVMAHRLGRNPRVREMIAGAWEETQEALAEDMAATRRYVMRRLLAHSKGGTDMVQMRALELMARASGLFREPDAPAAGKASPDALKRDLAQHLRLVGRTGTDAG